MFTPISSVIYPLFHPSKILRSIFLLHERSDGLPYFFPNNACPRCPTTRCTACAKRAKSQGSVTSGATHALVTSTQPRARIRRFGG